MKFAWVFIAGAAGLAGCASLGGHFTRGQELSRQAQHDQAITEFYIAAQEQPQRAEVQLALADALEAKHRPDEAFKALQRAYELAPDDPEVKRRLAAGLTQRGIEYERAGRISDAYASWQQAASLNPQSEAAARLAKLYSDQGQDDKAAAAYQELLKVSPKDPEMYRSLGLTYYKQGKLDEAVAAFQQVLRLAPQDATAFNNLGSAYLKGGLLDEAIAAFEQAVYFEPKLAAAHNNWGTALFQQARYVRARQEWEMTLKLEPGNETARRNLAALQALGY